MSTNVGKIDLGLGLNYNQFNKDLANIAPKASGLIQKGFGKIGALAAVAFSTKMLFNFGKGAIDLASDLVEVQNVVDVTFGGMANQINNFSKNALEQFGLAELSAKKYTSTMGAMLKSSGLAGQSMTDMSIEMTKLSADMASFYNLSNEVAFNKIRAGISGETEPLKQLGINMNVANLEAYALSKGIKKTYQNMSQAEQVTLRYNYLMHTAADSIGDFARNSDTWANQIKVLGERWNIFKGTMGGGFMTMLTPAIKGLNFLIAKLQTAANYFKAFMDLIFGKKKQDNSVDKVAQSVTDTASNADAASAGIGKVGKAAKKAGKDAMSGAMGFDELNTLSKASGSDTGIDDEGVGGGETADFGDISVGEVDLGVDAITQQIEEMFAKMKTQMEGAMLFFEPLGLAFENIANRGRQSFEANMPLLKTSIDNVLAELNTSFDTVWGTVLSNAQPFADNIQSIFIGIIDGWDLIFPSMISIWEGFSILMIANLTGFVNTFVSIFFTIIDGVALVLEPLTQLVFGIIKTVFDSVADFLTLHMADIKTTIESGWEMIRIGIEGIINAIALVLHDIFDGLLVWWQKNSDGVYEILLSTWNTIWFVLKTIWEVIYAIAENTFANLALFFTENSDSISALFEAVWNTIWVMLSTVWGIILDVAMYVFGEMKKFWDKWGVDILKIFDAIWAIASAAFGVFLDFLTGAFNVFSKLFIGDWKGAWEESQKAGEKIWNSISKLLSAIWDGIKLAASIIWDIITEYVLEKWTAIKTGIKNTSTSLIEAIKSPFVIAKNWIDNLISDAVNWGKNLIDNIIKGIKSKIQDVADTMSSVANTIKDFLGFSSPTKKGPGSTADKWMPNFIGMLSDGIDDNLGQIKRSIGLTSDILGSLSEEQYKLSQPELLAVSGRSSSSHSDTSDDINVKMEEYNNKMLLILEEIRRLLELDDDDLKVIENIINLDGEVIYSNQQKIKASRGIDFGMGVFAR